MTSNRPTKRLILFPQDKGGIGKSFVATLLHDYLKEKGVSLKAFDLDHANSTFHRYVPEAEFLDTDVETHRLGALDRLTEAFGEADYVLADNRASGGTKVIAYLEESRLPALQEEIGFALVFLVIAVDDKDANSQIAELLERYGDRVRWLVARNLRDGGQLPLYSQSNSRKRLMAHAAVEIDIPCLAEVTRNRLQLANLTVGHGRTSAKLPLLDRSRCIRYHEQMAGEFAKAERLLFA
ncbi:MAG TPA: division plane positioning ATPase MipZ [Candidatus Limnocylindria bacterium]|jgi:hypothetical protein|nr:division plane positioning ATPase MipZ [Candidatus Limnocylindria bacterium]